MININIFSTTGDPSSVTAAYTWPQGPLPSGKVVGRQGNALLVELTDGGVAVISAPASEVVFRQQGNAPLVDLSWAF